VHKNPLRRVFYCLGIITPPKVALGVTIVIFKLKHHSKSWLLFLANKHAPSELRLKAEHDAFAGVSLAGMAQRFGLINRRLAGLQEALNGEN